MRTPGSSNFSGIRARSLLLAAVAVGAAGRCGYTPLPVGRAPVGVFVEPVEPVGPTVDGAAEVDAALAQAVGRHAAFFLTTEDDAELRIRARVQSAGGAGARLAPLSDPGLRPGRYAVQIELRAEVLDTEGDVVWRGSELGQSVVLSPRGRLTALDGAGRRGFQQASTEAAERLLAAFSRSWGR